MRAHYFQHVPFEGLGSIEPWLRDNGHDITSTRFFESWELPSIDEIDLLVVMGGPMSVNDEGTHPWLEDEKAFIRSAIAAKVPILGICLGAQLIASALGASVSANPDKEIGWFPLRSVAPDNDTVFQFPDGIEVFHWHGETFELPNDATRLVRSECCKNQAFQVGSNTLGLQFHLEMTPASAKAVVDNCREELVDGKYIQSETQILSAPQEQYEQTNKCMGEVLAYLLTSIH